MAATRKDLNQPDQGELRRIEESEALLHATLDEIVDSVKELATTPGSDDVAATAITWMGAARSVIGGLAELEMVRIGQQAVLTRDQAMEVIDVAMREAPVTSEQTEAFARHVKDAIAGAFSARTVEPEA